MRNSLSMGDFAFFSQQQLPPHVRIWDSVTLNTLHVIGTGFFDRAVTCIAFSKSVSLSLRPAHSLHGEGSALSRRRRELWVAPGCVCRYDSETRPLPHPHLQRPPSSSQPSGCGASREEAWLQLSSGSAGRWPALALNVTCPSLGDPACPCCPHRLFTVTGLDSASVSPTSSLSASPSSSEMYVQGACCVHTQAAHLHPRALPPFSNPISTRSVWCQGRARQP